MLQFRPGSVDTTPIGLALWEAGMGYHEFLAYLYDRPHTRRLAVALAEAITSRHLAEEAPTPAVAR